jgi:hypothetical protein
MSTTIITTVTKRDVKVPRVNVTADRPAYYRAYMKRNPDKRRAYQERYLQKKYSVSTQQVREAMASINAPDTMTKDYWDQVESRRVERVAEKHKITTMAETHDALAAFWTTCKTCDQRITTI